MGYTHYWRRKADLSNGWTNFLADVRKLMANLPPTSESSGGFYKEVPLVVRGSNGDGQPIVSVNEIRLNGDTSQIYEGEDMAHESFYFPKKIPKELLNRASADERKEGYYFDFTKTARKPYDIVVQCILLLAEKHFGDKVRVDSDGGDDDWEQAKILLRRLNLMAA